MLKFLGKKIVDEGVSPGCVLLVGNSKEIFHLSAHGRQTYSDMSKSVLTSTIYDIASITKIITATAVLVLVDRGVISLGDKLKRFFDCKYGRDISIQHLLSYSAIINASMTELATKFKNPKRIEERIMLADLACKPGKRAEYRSVNSYLLGRVVECVTGQKLDHFFINEIFVPLGMYRTVFNPHAGHFSNIAPSGYIDKRGFAHGEPYDQSAFALGGIAGHAGLFSTAEDLYKFCRMWLNNGLANGVRFFSERLTEEAFKSHAQSDKMTFGLGWFLKCPWMGRYRKRIVGHAGFTGCIVNLSHRDDLIVILLTNSTMKGERGNFYIHNIKIMDKIIRLSDICKSSSSFHPEKNMILS